MAKPIIYRSKIVIDVLTPEPIKDMSMQEILHEADSGAFIADIRKQALNEEMTDPQSIRTKLKMMGNDGTFFDDVLDDSVSARTQS